MVRSSQAEDIVSKYFDALVKNRSQPEIGLLIGKPSLGSRDLIFDVLATPSVEGEPVLSVTVAEASGSSKKGQKPNTSASMQLDEAWVVTHAENVHRMLPGGISLLGIYLFSPDAAVHASTSTIWGVLNQLHEIMSHAASSPTQPPLFLHVDSTTSKISLKEMTPGSAGSLKPAEIKFGPTLNNLICLSCRYQVTLTVPSVSQTNATLKDQLSSVIQSESQHIQSAIPLINSTLPKLDQLLSDLLPDAKSVTQPVQIELLHTPFSNLRLPTTASTSACQVDGIGFLHGWVEGRAYLNKRETIGKGISDLKADLQKSLQSRLELMLEEAASMDAAADMDDKGADFAAARVSQQQPSTTGGDDDDAATHPLLKPWQGGNGFSQTLPRRVMLPWKSGVMLSDYLMEGETRDAAVERADEVLRLKLKGRSVVETEGIAEEEGESVWGFGVRHSRGDAQGRPRTGGAQAGSACTGLMMTAGVAALVALAGVAFSVMS